MGKANDPLIEAIDQAAEGLLQRISRDSDDKEAVSLADRVKAFAAIAAWAKQKAEMVPAKKGDSKFGKLRDRLNGKSVGRAVPSEGEEGTTTSDLGPSGTA